VFGQPPIPRFQAEPVLPSCSPTLLNTFKF
jgi:hypothetical protein